HLNMDVVQSYHIPVSAYKNIKKGESFTLPGGEVIENSRLTTDPDPCRSYAYCSDTIFDPEIVPYVQGVTMLYHESTYMKNNEERASLYFHSTAEQAATIAKMAKVGQLLIGHFSSRYDDLQPLLEEAREVFMDTELAEEGTKFSLESSPSQVLIHS